jgi:hypothetical protein
MALLAVNSQMANLTPGKNAEEIRATDYISVDHKGSSVNIKPTEASFIVYY